MRGRGGLLPRGERDRGLATLGIREQGIEFLRRCKISLLRLLLDLVQAANDIFPKYIRR